MNSPPGSSGLRPDRTLLTTRRAATSLNVTDKITAGFSTTYECPPTPWTRVGRSGGEKCADVDEMTAGEIAKLDEFLEAQGRNLAKVRALPIVDEIVVPAVDLYQRGTDLIPGRASQYFGHLFLLCERGLLSAVSQILRMMPDDSAAATRRAVEMARVAVAVKHNSANYAIWLSYEERLARWEARGRREKPKPVSPKYTFPKDHRVLHLLNSSIGALSDAAVHFTPEFLAQLRPTKVSESARAITMSVPFFVTDSARLFHSLLYVTTVHGLILDAFDECFDGAFRADPAWEAESARLISAVEAWGPKLLAMMPPDASPPGGEGRPAQPEGDPHGSPR